MSDLTEFLSERCPFCEGHKAKNTAFCRPCYFSLPVIMRQALYHRFGEGYEEALAAAKEWLKKDSDQMRAAAK